MTKQKVKIYFIIFFIFLLFNFFCNDSIAISRISDRISLSWPNTGVDHNITFLATENIPPLGQIVVTPESGFFLIESGFDYTDVDLATSSSETGVFVNRNLASSTSNINDGVFVVASTTNGSITIILNSSYGINSNEYVKIKLGKNTDYGNIGDKQIINSTSTRSYAINIRINDVAGNQVETAMTKIAILQPITMGASSEKRRLFGSPIGFLSYGTTETIMSIITNYNSRCKYGIASGTPYASIPNDFSYVNFSDYRTHHSATLSSIANGESYSYYIRCIDEYGITDNITGCVYTASTTPQTNASGTPITMFDCIDYEISFSIVAEEGDGGGDEEEGDGSGDGETDADGGSGGGGSGGGSGGGIGQDRGRTTGIYLPYPPPPGEPGVVFEGFAYSSSKVTFLKDGFEEGITNANVDAEFGAFITDLTKGIYTFGIWAEDYDKRKSPTQSFTFWVDDGIQTTVSDIFLPPTIELNKNTVSAGEIIEVFGYTIPNSTIETWFYLSQTGTIDESKVIKNNMQANNLGKWAVYINTAGVEEGTYNIKARSNKDIIGDSEFSKILTCGVGSSLEQKNNCEGADLNGDGKVNITDFSILLYYWETNDDCADQNDDGTVNIIDFSIMMYYWTG